MTEIKLSDITESVMAKGENTTLLRFSAEGIHPVFSKEILATYALMEWPLVGSDAECLRCYGVLMSHGKVHVAEVFFLRQGKEETFTGEYLGTTKVFSVALPENHYDPELDEELGDLLWRQAGGNA